MEGAARAAVATATAPAQEVAPEAAVTAKEAWAEAATATATVPSAGGRDDNRVGVKPPPYYPPPVTDITLPPGS